MTTQQQQAIIRECKRQSESCLYTSTALFEWAKSVKIQNRWLNALPIALGATASFSFVADLYPALAAILALLAGVIPSIYEKLNIEKHTEDMLWQAGQYKILQDRFTQAAEITALDADQHKLNTDYESLLLKLDEIRARPILVPEKYFKRGQDKIKSGDYNSDVTPAPTV